MLFGKLIEMFIQDDTGYFNGGFGLFGTNLQEKAFP